MIRGGFNGGGSTTNCTAGSGGGATDLRLEKNDVFHRVIVAGAGGGCDNTVGYFQGDDDGSGGAGGKEEAQGFWINGIYNSSYLATQKSGFSFAQGEAPRQLGSNSPNGKKDYSGSYDRAGAGGGWYGGFASHHGNGGAGGGSSFILTSSSNVPTESIDVYDEFYKYQTTDKYAFTNKQYGFTSPKHQAGVWAGNGYAIITILASDLLTKTCYRLPFSFIPTLIFLINNSV
jgi:hypothetical protein